MKQVRIIYHLARADFLERSRRYSFLVMLGAVVFLGYQAAIGNINVQLGNYRGELNSAWVGSTMAVIASFILSWFGFYLVKGSVTRDRETGVGQIMATTPLTRPLYTFGKWLSNFAMMTSMVMVLALMGIAIQLFAGESKQLDLIILLLPFLYLALPMLALVSAIAVLFESIVFLQGGFGNMVYFIFFSILFPLASVLNKTTPALEPVGLALLHQSMGVAVKAAFPEYAGGIMLGSSDIPILGTFLWKGVDWTPDIVSQRISIFVFGIAVALLASIFFDRFDPSRSKPRRTKSAASPSKPEAATKSQALSQPILLTPLATSQDGFVFGRVLVSELKLILKGQRWWWYAGVIGLFIASFANTPENVRAFVLPFTWLWPILIWSGMGNREITNNTQQMVFSSAAPLLRQLPATWLAGFIVTFLTGSGAALNFLSAGDMASLLTWFSAALFIPSFALALGVWSNSHKLFEVLYITMWYFALNKLEPVDFLGANSNGNIGFFIPFSVTLIAAAFIGRARQLRN